MFNKFILITTLSLAFCGDGATALSIQEAQSCIDQNVQVALTSKDQTGIAELFDIPSLTMSSIGPGWDRIEPDEWLAAQAVAKKLLLDKIMTERKYFSGFKAKVTVVKEKIEKQLTIAKGHVIEGELARSDFVVNLRNSCRIASIKIENTFISSSIWIWLRKQPAMDRFRDMAAKAIRNNQKPRVNQ